MSAIGKQRGIKPFSALRPWIGMIATAGLVAMLPISGYGAEEGKPSETEKTAEAGNAAEETKTEAYISLYILGSNPLNRNVELSDDPFPQTSVGGGLGGGIKVGSYPAFANRILGIEAELFGHNGDIVAPLTTTGGVTRSANATLNVVNAMVNLLLRYPGDVLQPYVGVGGGLSGGFLRGADIQQSQIGTFTGNAGDAAFGYQFLAGLRVNVSERFFLFSEYKYFLANYKWESEDVLGAAGPSASLDFRTHIVAGGVGFKF